MNWSFAGALFAVAMSLLPVEASAGDPFAGKAVYDTHCAFCHGPNGRPTLPGAPAFARGERLQFPDIMLMQSIKNGKNMCPSQRRVIPDMDLFNVIAYIRMLRR